MGSGRHGSDHDYGKRRKHFYPSSTRRDFKSAAPGGAPPQAGPGSAALSLLKPPLRVDKPPGDYASRGRYRDPPATGPAPAAPLLSPLQPARTNSYSKDARYGAYAKPQSYSSYPSGYYQDRSHNAYGSFSSAKRQEPDHNGFPAASRDTPNGAFPLRLDSPGSYPRDGRDSRDSRDSRESWRAERPKLSSGPGSAKAFPLRNFNPNNIPVSARGLNGLVSSVSGDCKKDRYDSYDEHYSSRWKSYSSPRSEKPERSSLSGSTGRTHPSKDRIRSSGLTNSVGTPKRSDSYHPPKLHSQPTHRYTDRYARPRQDDGNDENDYEHADRKYFEKSQSPLEFRHDNREDSRADEDLNIDDEDRMDEDENDVDDEEDEDEDDENEDTLEHEVDEKKPEHEVVSKIDEPETQEKKPHFLTEEIAIGNKLDTDGAVDYPDGCNYPLEKLECQYRRLEKEFRHVTDHYTLKYVPSKPVTDFSQYPFYKFNLAQFARNYKSYTNDLKQRRRELKKKQLALWLKYDSMWKDNDKRRANLEEQLKVIHPADDEARRELESIDIRPKSNDQAAEVRTPSSEQQAQSGRRNRRHGDLVTTEAEFQEILKSLENQLNEDPMVKAKRVSADIPDLYLDPVDIQTYKFMDSNNIVHDKDAWAQRIHSDFVDNFTEKEHDLFTEAFCRAPKRFGEISRQIGGLRTPQECVLHYYMTKKAVNYKILVSQYKKKASRKNPRKKSKSKTGNVQDPVLSETPVDTVENLETDGNGSLPLPNDTGVLLEDNQKKRIAVDTPLSVDESIEPPKKKTKKKKEDVKVQPTQEESVVNHTVIVATKQEILPAPEVTEPVATTSIEGKPVQGEIQDQFTTVDSVGDGDHGHLGEEKRKHISSYWSITEVNEFPHLLNTYGSRWTSIAEKLATKTATMVRNYFQRNAAKYGWNEVVAAADGRLAQRSNLPSEGSFSNLDTTIVVNPQRTSQIEVPEREIHIYDPGEEKAALHGGRISVGGLLGDSIADAGPAKVPIGTFQNYQPERAFHVSTMGPSVHSLLSDYAPAAKPVEIKTMPSLNNPVPLTPVKIAPAEPVVKQEGQKSSIMNLLNSDSTPAKPVAAPPPPTRSNNLASLLNAPSSPAPASPAERKPAERANSIKSLLD